MKATDSCYFSIIIPCYNARNLIKAAFDSLEQQSFQDFEVICIDDCSKDSTYEYLQSLRSELKFPLTVLKNETNQGPGISRVRGIKEAKGEYLCFCDCDDWYELNAFEAIYNQLEKNNADICFFDVNRYLSSGKKIPLNWIAQMEGSNNKQDFIAHATDSLCTIAVRNDVLRRIEFPKSYNCEDGPAVVAMCVQSDVFTYINKPLYNYFYRENSLSTNINSRVVEGFMQAYGYLSNVFDAKYREAFVFHYIKYLLYGYSLNAYKIGMSVSEISRNLSSFYKDYPDWNKNAYINDLPLRKRAWIWCLTHNLSLLLSIYIRLPKIVYKLRSLFS